MKPIRIPIAGLLAAWLAAACAPVPPPVETAEDGFFKPEARQIFAAGYANITEKYIVPVGTNRLALSGLRGLGSIDPALTVNRSGSDVVLSEGDRVVARFPAPADDDIAGWAALTVNVCAAARQASEDLRRANAEKIYQAVFDGVMSQLDIYSRYAGAEEARKKRARRDGFGGIGIQFRVEAGQVWITSVLRETPAGRVGLKEGDRITHVGTVPVAGLSLRQVVAQLRGPPYTRVAITVRREGIDGPLIFDLERALIVPPTVIYAEADGIATIRITGFNNRTARSLSAKLKKLGKDLGNRIKGIILDLRGNPGGLLKQSVRVVDLFVRQGAILATRGRHPDTVRHYEAGGRDLTNGVPLVVLMDGNSASAAEIVAAALQDRKRAVIIGTTSYGKGTVQTVIPLPNEGEVTLTWSRLIAPSGYMLDGLGVYPTICTSGTAGSIADVIDGALATRAQTSTVAEAWHQVPIDDRARRKELRASCPPEPRKAALDVEIARRVVSDRALYARASDLLAAATAERR